MYCKEVLQPTLSSYQSPDNSEAAHPLDPLIHFWHPATACHTERQDPILRADSRHVHENSAPTNLDELIPSRQDLPGKPIVNLVRQGVRKLGSPY